MSEVSFLKDLAGLLEVNFKELNPDFKLNYYQTWDSLSVVSTIALLEKYFGIMVEG